MATIRLYDSPIIILGPENIPLNESEKRFNKSFRLFNIGYNSYLQEDYDKAINYLNKGIASNYNHSLCYYYRAIIYFKKEKYKLAIRDIDKYCLQQQKCSKGHFLKHKIFTKLFEKTKNYKFIKLSKLVLKQAIKNNINYKIFDTSIN